MAKIIKAADVVTQISVDPAQQTISSGPNDGQAYYRARHDGRGFITTQEFFDAHRAGNVAEVSLTESSYEVDDPLTPGEKIKRDSWQLSSWATFDQVVAVTQNVNKLRLAEKRGEVEMQKLEQQELGKMKLTDETVAELKEALGL